jgi:hypothetical protein
MVRLKLSRNTVSNKDKLNRPPLTAGRLRPGTEGRWIEADSVGVLAAGSRRLVFGLEPRRFISYPWASEANGLSSCVVETRSTSQILAAEPAGPKMRLFEIGQAAELAVVIDRLRTCEGVRRL